MALLAEFGREINTLFYQRKVILKQMQRLASHNQRISVHQILSRPTLFNQFPRRITLV